MSTGNGFVERVLVECLGKFPCVPDSSDNPLVGVNYIISRICGYDPTGKWAKACRAKALELELAEMTINRQPVIRLLSMQRLLEAMQEYEKR